MKLKISDVTWKIRLLTVDKYIAEYGDDSRAITDVHAHTVDFRRDIVTLELVRHELVHCYFALAMVTSSQLTMDQTEEVFAELMSKYGEQYIQNSRKVFNYLQKRMKINEKV